MVDILIKNISWLVTIDDQRRITNNSSVAIDEGKIVDMGDSEHVAKRNSGDIVIDGRGRIVLPGLFNCHTHMFQDFLRGLFDDYELVTWVGKLYGSRLAECLTEKHVRASARLGCLENLKSGSTFILDHHLMRTTEEAIDEVAGAMKESGVRGLVARGIREYTKQSKLYGIPQKYFPYSPEEELAITRRVMKKWNEDFSTVKVCPGPASIPNGGPDIYKASKQLANEFNVPLHTHIAETRDEVESARQAYGYGELEFMYRNGILDSRTHVVHGVWLNDVEISMMASSGAHHIHCPVSNMYLASGVAPIQRLRHLNVNIALGSDGPASNNNQDMFEVLKSTALLQKVSSLNAASITCEEVLEMATLGGAKASGFPELVGGINVGNAADLVVVNALRPHIAPVHRPNSSLVYCAKGSDVETVIVNGELVVENGKALRVDEEKIVKDAHELASELVEETGLSEIIRNPWKKRQKSV